MWMRRVRRIEKYTGGKRMQLSKKINKLTERIEYLEKQLDVQTFGVKRFQCYDSDIRFYTGLPNYNIFIHCTLF